MISSSVGRVLVVGLTALLAFVAPLVHAANRYPIILVHGFAGWGRDEMAGLKYWGGLHGDYEQQLVKDGFDVRTAAVGPFASNWDRACELYAYIKGGCVNYGPNHASHYNHTLTGRCYPGIYPEWGTVVGGKVQKVHLVGHSMGGQTIRMLAQLLAHGSQGAPIEEDPSSHPLFAGGKEHWVHSITTVSTPNQGTLLANAASVRGDLVENTAAAVLGAAGVFGNNSLYDPKLEQWGVSPKGEDESMRDFIRRVFSNGMFQPGFEDISLHSLSTKGADDDLRWVQTLPNIFYHSIANKDTFKLLGYHLPRVHSMLLPLQGVATFLGSSYPLKNGFTEDWQPNDGVVNTVSMYSDGKAPMVGKDEHTSITGKWRIVAEFDTLDHLAIVGMKPFRNVYDIYKLQAALLYDLPETDERRRLEEGPVVHETSPDIVQPIYKITQELNDANLEEDVQAFCADTQDLELLSFCKEYKSRRA